MKIRCAPVMMALAFCAIAKVANADQPPTMMTAGLEQAMLKTQVAADALNVNYQAQVLQNAQFSVSAEATLDNGAVSAAVDKAQYQDPAQQSGKLGVLSDDLAVDSFNDSVMQPTVQRYAESATAKIDTQVAGKNFSQQDFNVYQIAGSKGSVSFTQGIETTSDTAIASAPDNFIAKRDVPPAEDSGQSSDEVADEMRLATGQPAQRIAAAKLRPPMKDWVGVHGQFHLSSVYT